MGVLGYLLYYWQRSDDMSMVLLRIDTHLITALDICGGAKAVKNTLHCAAYQATTIYFPTLTRLL
jgi:hypothetical protein